MIIGFCLLVMISVVFLEKQKKLPLKALLNDIGIITISLILIFILPILFIYITCILL